MSELTLRWQQQRWHCPECGPVLDRSLEVFVDGRRLGRWQEDGHQGRPLPVHQVESALVDALNLPFEWHEHVRSLRARQGSREALDAVFWAQLEQQGHRARQSLQVFTSPDECAPL